MDAKGRNEDSCYEKASLKNTLVSGSIESRNLTNHFQPVRFHTINDHITDHIVAHIEGGNGDQGILVGIKRNKFIGIESNKKSVGPCVLSIVLFCF